MKIEVELAGLFAEHLDDANKKRTVDLPEETEIKGLLQELNFNFDQVDVEPTIIVNGKTCRENYKFKEGDKVIILNLLNGG